MSVTPWLPTVTRINDGDAIDQATLNKPIDQLTQRDQHLYDKFAELTNKSVLITTSQPIHPKETFVSGELCLAYYKSDANGAGLAKGVTGFSSNSSSSMFTPNLSNYSFGLVKAVNTADNTADLYIEGLCDLSVDLDDSLRGLIQKNADGTVESFAVGPYYLSARSPGKITRDPSGVPVYVGYAISKTQFVLHTNVDEFSQFFINYRFHILDRVAGLPALTGSTWTITNTDLTKLGWVPADSGAPAGALFRYNIPSTDNLNADTALTTAERAEAAELGRNLPPVPANFNQLYVNGLLLRYNDMYDTAGRYSVNEYGIWWHSNTNGEQPWNSLYPRTAPFGNPTSWAAIKTGLGTNRNNIFMSFSKFNPALRTQLVSSLTPLNTAENRSSNFIKFYSKDAPSLTANTGDLLVDIIAPVNETGYALTANGAVPSQVYPSSTSPTFTSNRAVAAIQYSKPDGAFKVVVTPVVSKILGSKGIGVTETPTGSGIWQLSYLSEGAVGTVDSIEPINARLEFRGLSSYIKLPAVYTPEYGIIGKIVLPQGYYSNKDLKIAFHLFGDTSVTTTGENNVSFNFSYASVSALNGVSPTAFTTVSSVTYPISAPANASFSIAANGDYTAYSSIKVSPVELTIPGAFISEDSIVSFKITRVAPAASAYTGSIGILATYWNIPTAAT